jgi:DNA-binding transcriptional regulator PaaX
VGKLEAESKKRKKRADVQRIVLNTVGMAGLLSAALLAPNVVKTLDTMGLVPNNRRGDSIRQARNNLVKGGYLRWEDRKLRLTDKGEKKLRSLELKDYQLPKPKRWDGRWRVLIFDIPEHRKGLRDKVRRTLMTVGFVRLQDSVWIYPHDCEELIALLKADFKIGKDMLYMIVDTLEYDTPVRARFGLE